MKSLSLKDVAELLVRAFQRDECRTAGPGEQSGLRSVPSGAERKLKAADGTGTLLIVV